MNKPYIICHMMTSVDGRIDCAMTSQLPGVEDYYKTLDGLNVPTTVSGRVTAELEMAEPGFFEAKNSETYTQEGFSKKADAKGYEIIVDTKGKLLWPDASDMDKPYLIITSEQVTKEYLAYLDGQHISRDFSISSIICTAFSASSASAQISTPYTPNPATPYAATLELGSCVNAAIPFSFSISTSISASMIFSAL